ncbi:MAG: hypothetical protein ABIQ02_01540 [Saprospiraceae bacterium]
MKSTTCKGSNGQYLEEHQSEAAAQIAAERIKKEYGHDLIANKCPRCGYWHLTVASQSRLCMFCTDRALFQKDLYTTRQDAEAMAIRVAKEKRIRLVPYKCPYSSGWHLSKARTRV